MTNTDDNTTTLTGSDDDRDHIVGYQCPHCESRFTTHGAIATAYLAESLANVHFSFNHPNSDADPEPITEDTDTDD